MKKYIMLEWYNYHFYPIKDDLFVDLRHLVEFLSTDYRFYDQTFFNQSLSFYNSSFIYHDLDYKILHIGFSEWEVCTEIDVPCDLAFPNFVNQNNSCNISVINFKEFIEKWRVLKAQHFSFAMIYRNDNDWIDCKGFQLKEEMEQSVKDFVVGVC